MNGSYPPAIYKERVIHHKIPSTLTLPFTDAFKHRDPPTVPRGGHWSPTALIRVLASLTAQPQL